MLKISIPVPCHEDWDKMTPDHTGRHCSSCAKSVVDFTGMSDDEVKHFFLNKKEDERVCGRFKQTQLHSIVIELPQNILHINMPLWKKFLAACLIVFSTTLFSCETKVNGKAMAVTEIKNDGNLLSNHAYVGGISFTMDTSKTTIETYSTTVGDLAVVVMDTATEDIQGAIALADDTVVIKNDTIPGFTKKGEVDATYILSRQDTLKINDPVTPAKPKKEKTLRVDEPKTDAIFMGLPIPTVTKRSRPDSADCNTINNYH